jgi:hypothetical protein
MEAPFPPSFGFRSGDRGTHTSRTLMLAELGRLLEAQPPGTPRDAYARAVVEDNVLGKRTTSNRRLTNQRLGELFALDPGVPLFRVLRRLWGMDEAARPLLALLCALARDPLLRASAPAILDLPVGEALVRQALLDTLRDAVGNRLNEGILDKVARNASSSWTQSGHLQGRVRKIRRQVSPTPVATAYALLLGYMQGLRGQRLFQTPWTRALDSGYDRLLALAADARRLGLLDLKRGGDVIEIAFSPLLTEEERRTAHG